MAATELRHESTVGGAYASTTTPLVDGDEPARSTLLGRLRALIPRDSLSRKTLATGVLLLGFCFTMSVIHAWRPAHASEVFRWAPPPPAVGVDDVDDADETSSARPPRLPSVEFVCDEGGLSVWRAGGEFNGGARLLSRKLVHAARRLLFFACQNSTYCEQLGRTHEGAAITLEISPPYSGQLTFCAVRGLPLACSELRYLMDYCDAKLSSLQPRDPRAGDYGGRPRG